MNRTQKQILENKLELLKKLEEMESGTRFKARDIDVHGATLFHNKKYGLYQVVGTESVWHQTDENTMKKGEVNIYERTKKSLEEVEYPVYGKHNPIDVLKNEFESVIVREMRCIVFSLERIDRLMQEYEDLFE